MVRKLRRFPWAQHENLMVKYLLRTVKGSYSHIATTASVTATLARYHPSLSVTLADCLLEEVTRLRLQLLWQHTLLSAPNYSSSMHQVLQRVPEFTGRCCTMLRFIWCLYLA